MASPQAGRPGRAEAQAPPREPPLREPVEGGVERVQTQDKRDPDIASSRDPNVRDLDVEGSPAILSSASESVSAPTRRELQRVKSRLVHMSEHLRESLKATKVELWQAIEEIGAASAFEKLMDERTDMLSEALRTGLDTIREEFFGLMEPLTFANAVRGEEMAAELVMLRRRSAELEQRT